MKLIIALALLTTALANPVAEPFAEPAPARLTTNIAQVSCSILTNDLRCRYHPSLSNNDIRHYFQKGNSASFTCWQYGSCVTDGGCTGSSCGSGKCDVWDYNPTYDCFVSAHYTSGACTTSSIPRCDFSKE